MKERLQPSRRVCIWLGAGILGTLIGCQNKEVEVHPSMEVERTRREQRAVPKADPEALPPPGVLSSPSRELTEAQKIEGLLVELESSDAVFIRNGSEYSGKKAAEHLRRKLKNADGRITTVQQFIDQLATRSSVSGRPYLVRTSDGMVMESGSWLNAALRRIEREHER